MIIIHTIFHSKLFRSWYIINKCFNDLLLKLRNYKIFKIMKLRKKAEKADCNATITII